MTSARRCFNLVSEHAELAVVRRYVLLGLLLLAATGSVQARRMRGWTYQEMFDTSDLVVIGFPTRTHDTAERANLPDIFMAAPDGTKAGLSTVGAETAFRVATILKGEKALKDFVVHHYRLLKPDAVVFDAPNLIAFHPLPTPPFLLFLVRESDGRYAPCSGQTDPALFSILELQGRAE